MRRGDLVLVAVPGDYGKPRPALVIQSDLFNETHASITVAPVTSTIVDTPLFRVTVEPSRGNGLRLVSQIMVDKITTVRRQRVGQTIGYLEQDIMLRVSRALAFWLGIAA
ncbi:MAG TPA: type II toxin-antitoxin system PemK/MazF family toxin [Candidatus Methylomirabilis sp.]|nr:type II toxin-antitoxin system PemK/MazF family toxin [Candidatus Methylomirabilis sp.]